MRNLGPTLRRWRREWNLRREQNPKPDELALPRGHMRLAGYVVMQRAVRLYRPVKDCGHRIPEVYREAALGQSDGAGIAISDDPHRIGLVRHYHSLADMAREAGKPIFLLKPADGAIGAHLSAVHRAYADFGDLTRAIVGRVGGG